ncbi:MAG: hypothetical protein KME10_04215 [Plectolyngbya sp. WJT66-NPBG17]|jgi:hypothetical protein|nr:hypothetical protein [Plectolyngbya sp. WJT66-NPBG17]MBW4526553.1 hypothetical protein [Phormidium tanganyikae FI6-MK23]
MLNQTVSDLDVQHLKKRSLAHLYHYLTFKALQVPSTQQNGRMAAQFFQHAIKNDLTILWRWKTLLKAIFKIAVITSFPSKQSESVITTARQLLAR